MLTAQEIKKLPKGFTFVPKTSRQSYGKSTRFRRGTQCIAIHQPKMERVLDKKGNIVLDENKKPVLRDTGKTILRLQEIEDRRGLRGFKGVFLGEFGKWMVVKKKAED